MFLQITAVLFLVSFFLALRSARKIDEKPLVKDVKRSLDKHKVIYHSSSE